MEAIRSAQHILSTRNVKADGARRPYAPRKRTRFKRGYQIGAKRSFASDRFWPSAVTKRSG